MAQPESCLATHADIASFKRGSSVDAEIVALRDRLARLEQQKAAEAAKEREMKDFPLKALESIVEEKKKKIAQNRYSSSVPLARLYDQEKVAMLEPILAALSNIMVRLDALEAQ